MTPPLPIPRSARPITTYVKKYSSLYEKIRV
jgi:hypothetical protein